MHARLAAGAAHDLVGTGARAIHALGGGHQVGDLRWAVLGVTRELAPAIGQAQMDAARQASKAPPAITTPDDSPAVSDAS
jgi:hypothetical protein